MFIRGASHPRHRPRPSCRCPLAGRETSDTACRSRRMVLTRTALRCPYVGWRGGLPLPRSLRLARDTIGIGVASIAGDAECASIWPSCTDAYSALLLHCDGQPYTPRKKESAREQIYRSTWRMIATSREEARCGNGIDDTKAEWIPRWRRSPTPCKRVA